MASKPKRVGVRLTVDDHTMLKKKAKDAGLSMTDYLTAVALDKEIIVVEGLDAYLTEIRQIHHELHKIGNNFNQLKKLANMGKITFVGGRDMEKALNQYWEVLLNLTKAVKALKKAK